MDKLSLATGPLPPSKDQVKERLLHQIHAIGLELATLEDGGFTVIDENRIGMRHVDTMGQERGQIWFAPGMVGVPEDVLAYGSEARAIHVSRLGDKRLIVCESLIDSLLVAQGLTVTVPAGEYTVVSGSSWQTTPWEYENPVWWTRWDKVCVVGTATFAAKIQAHAHRNITVLSSIIQEGGWKAVFSPTWMTEWLKRGEPIAQPDGPDFGSELEGFAPVSIDGAFVAGHLHYAVTLLERHSEIVSNDSGEPELVQTARRLVRIVKSDGTLQKISEAPAPSETPAEHRVFCLEDGTLVTGVPKPGRKRSWSVQSIFAYTRGEAQARPLADLLADIVSVLRARVWLPHEPDFYVLALAVVVSYLQDIFDAVPLFLAVGNANTGKTQLGLAMASVAANGEIISRATAATLSRKIDRNRGFVILDDLEEIATKGPNKQTQFTELIQLLKLSYKKDTATRDVTDGREQNTLNYFGVKLITNTQGTDGILGSRMLKILSGKKPRQVTLPATTINTCKLRDDLHIWAFSNAGIVAREYACLPLVTDRSEEITASLRVIARLSKSSDFERHLDRHMKPAIPSTAADLEMHLRAVIDEMVGAGAKFVIPSKVAEALHRKLIDAGIEVPNHLTSEWIGIRLRALEYIAPGAKPARKWIDGEFPRIYPLNLAGRSEIPGRTDPSQPAAARK